MGYPTASQQPTSDNDRKPQLQVGCGAERWAAISAVTTNFMPPREGGELPLAVRFPEPDDITAYAHMVRDGRLGTEQDVAQLRQAARSIIKYTRTADTSIRPGDCTVEVSYTGPRGSVCPEDAELVLAMSQPEAFALSSEDEAFLQGCYGLFAGKRLLRDIPSALRPVARQRRTQLATMLRLAHPERFSYEELARIVDRRATLSALLHPAPQPPEALVLAPPEPVQASDEELPSEDPDDTVGTDIELAPVELAPEPDTPKRPRRPRQWNEDLTGDEPVDAVLVGDIVPRTQAHEVRTHRRPRSRRHFLARSIAALVCVATLAAAALTVGRIVAERKEYEGPLPGTSQEAAPSEPPPTVGGQGEPKKEEPPAPPVEEHHLVTIEDKYDPAARTGAIMFEVEDYAAQLGYSGVTLAQSYELTKRTLEYMGMTWSQAREISVGDQFKFPPSQTMSQWLSEIIGPAANNSLPQYN